MTVAIVEAISLFNANLFISLNSFHYCWRTKFFDLKFDKRNGVAVASYPFTGTEFACPNFRSCLYNCTVFQILVCEICFKLRYRTGYICFTRLRESNSAVRDNTYLFIAGYVSLHFNRNGALVFSACLLFKRSFSRKPNDNIAFYKFSIFVIIVRRVWTF